MNPGHVITFIVMQEEQCLFYRSKLIKLSMPVGICDLSRNIWGVQAPG